MATIDFGGCLSTYWYVWTINSLGSVFCTASSILVSFVCFKFLSKPPSSKPSMPKRPDSSSSQYRSQSAASNRSGSAWGHR